MPVTGGTTATDACARAFRQTDTTGANSHFVDDQLLFLVASHSQDFPSLLAVSAFVSVHF